MATPFSATPPKGGGHAPRAEGPVRGGDGGLQWRRAVGREGQRGAQPRHDVLQPLPLVLRAVVGHEVEELPVAQAAADGGAEVRHQQVELRQDEDVARGQAKPPLHPGHRWWRGNTGFILRNSI